jgi:hypothetical protein
MTPHSRRWAVAAAVLALMVSIRVMVVGVRALIGMLEGKLTTVFLVLSAPVWLTAGVIMLGTCAVSVGALREGLRSARRTNAARLAGVFGVLGEIA